MMRLSFLRSAVFLAAAMAVVLAAIVACSSAEPEQAAQQAAPAAQAAPTTAPAPAAPAAQAPTAAPAAMASDAVPPRAADAAAQRGGILNVAYFRKASSPDGYQAGGTFDRMYFFTGNEVAVAIGKDSQYDPAESLAHSFEVEDGGSRVRFNLREGVLFQGGFGEMTSADVAFSFGRWFDSEAGCRGCPSTFPIGYRRGRRGRLHGRRDYGSAGRQSYRQDVRPRQHRSFQSELGCGRPGRP